MRAGQVLAPRGENQQVVAIRPDSIFARLSREPVEPRGHATRRDRQSFVYAAAISAARLPHWVNICRNQISASRPLSP